METSKPQLTPELRHALLSHPDEPLYIADKETGKVFLLVAMGAIPELDEEYVRKGLQLAREQIAREQISSRSTAELILEAQRRESLRT